ncbi:hypothetical protein FUA23_21050 [Neolewinella aurantiaca]|uniref:Lipocalin-like domain-containing protein n=1 Tax=Neolewinella aurantiaca TaxID=2602767 RepID=A0A5C7F336_9BACT|nr:hypothetical protein [Neolewinella aurantiaca]TXF84733.1 hypothetical protein FUA23_21050 [Neolewinella aurantiaca]
MQKINILLFVIVAGLTFSCGDQEASAEPAAPTFEETLLGTWETIEIEAHCPTYLGQDTTVHQLIKEADWGRQYGAKPSRTVYTADGKLKRTYYNVRGDITDVTNGLWKTVGEDSLFVIEPNTTLSYKHELDGSRLTLTGKVDWDYDGEADDDYRAVLRLVSRTN